MIMAGLLSIATMTLYGKLPVTKVDNATPAEMVGIDMATDAAKSNVASGGVPDGAAIIVNGHLKSTGVPSAGVSAVENAVAKSGLSTLKGASVFVVNQPVTDAYLKLSSLGADAVYFVNGADAVVAAGIVPESAYDDSSVDATARLAPLKSVPFPEAQRLIKK